jgi:hypothetical protein
MFTFRLHEIGFERLSNAARSDRCLKEQTIYPIFENRVSGELAYSVFRQTADYLLALAKRTTIRKTNQIR